jgi:hypothetical protein
VLCTKVVDGFRLVVGRRSRQEWSPVRSDGGPRSRDDDISTCNLTPPWTLLPLFDFKHLQLCSLVRQAIIGRAAAHAHRAQVHINRKTIRNTSRNLSLARSLQPPCLYHIYSPWLKHPQSAHYEVSLPSLYSFILSANPSAIKEINRINQRELELGLAGKGSWHDEYKGRVPPTSAHRMRLIRQTLPIFSSEVSPTS